MPASGEWTHNGSAAGLRELALRCRATGQVELLKDNAKAIRVATAPARKAVKAKLREVMPKAGGANVYLSKLPVRTAVTYGSKTAGVAIRSRKRGSDLRRLDAGRLMHPSPGNNRKEWRATPVPSGWWEEALRPLDAGVRAALEVQQRETAIKAGFR